MAWAAESVGSQKTARTFLDVAQRHTARWLQPNENWAGRYGIHAVTNLPRGQLVGAEAYEAACKAVYTDRSTRSTNTPYFGTHVLNALALLGRHE